MRLFREKEESPHSSEYPPTNGYSDNGAGGYDDDLHVECPPHTTERKLVARIDAHVMPFLCVMYRTYCPKSIPIKCIELTWTKSSPSWIEST